MKREGDLLFDLIVDAVDLLPGLAKCKAALHDLHPQVIFLVDHHAEAFVGVDGDAAGALDVSKFATDQLTLNEEVAVKIRQSFDVDIRHVAPAIDQRQLVAKAALNDAAVGGRAVADEIELGQIASQSDARADDDVRFGPRPSQPLPTTTGQLI